MLSETVIKVISSIVPEENISLNEQMSKHTTFHIGGEAECFVEVENVQQLISLQKYLQLIEIPYYVIGNGSNLLVSDKGYPGVIIQIGSKMNQVTVEGNKIVAQAGALLSKVSRIAYEHQLTGLEFAQGIPGTIGGGIVMNAGAYGGEMKQVVTNVTVIDKNGNILELDNETMEFDYRFSIIKKHPFIVTEITLELQAGNQEEIKSKMDEYANARREKQPLEYPSAGSTFKRPLGHFAGKEIMDAGLKGYQIGGAQVSEKHCGFVINKDHATCEDVIALIRYIQETVKEHNDIILEPEVICLNEKI